MTYEQCTGWQKVEDIQAETIQLEIGSMQIFQDRHANTVREELSVSVSHHQYRIGSLVFSSFALMAGFIDIYLFLVDNSYPFHPYLGLAFCVGGGFLLATTILAIKGK